MKVEKTPISGILVITPDFFGDERGFFMETYARDKYREIGINEEFVQDNLSSSARGILRGLHFQNPTAQGKLVSVLQGEVFDVAVDIRSDSKTFGKWHGEFLSAENKKQMWLPPGFAHGFCVTSETALFTYKCTAPYSPEHEGSIRWDDPGIAIDWPINAPRLSLKDQDAPFLSQLNRKKLFNGAF